MKTVVDHDRPVPLEWDINQFSRSGAVVERKVHIKDVIRSREVGHN